MVKRSAGSLSGDLRSEASHCSIWGEIFLQTLHVFLGISGLPSYASGQCKFLRDLKRKKGEEKKKEKKRKPKTLEGHFIPEATSGCKEVTSQTVAGIRHIHLALRVAFVPGSQQVMQMAHDLHQSGSAAAVPTSLRQPLPALFLTLIIQLGSVQHLVWDSMQRAFLGSSLARTRVLSPVTR